MYSPVTKASIIERCYIVSQNKLMLRAIKNIYHFAQVTTFTRKMNEYSCRRQISRSEKLAARRYRISWTMLCCGTSEESINLPLCSILYTRVTIPHQCIINATSSSLLVPTIYRLWVTLAVAVAMVYALRKCRKSNRYRFYKGVGKLVWLRYSSDRRSTI